MDKKFAFRSNLSHERMFARLFRWTFNDADDTLSLAMTDKTTKESK